MAERTVDRQAWADFIAQAITDHAGGNTTRFAEMVGVKYKTVRRWLTKQTDVSEESIRAVGRALNIKPSVLLVRVGLYAATEVDATPAPDLSATDDPALQEILKANVSPRTKQRMIERLQEMRQREVDEVKWWIDQARGA
ncbi:hypothetical protein [Micromonospora endolithica]|uniref:HTH cro/C1-type domain-containing protein n=1 Tax=Micromonospora endolithica TaxID=230091 RepID=A0A3A9ZBH6_9ACTN|nr:hypothetical protein [Micromonospora endolithica]RKN45234.1 hypothetical protein D7223_16450 [Micromonospora endolithica]